MAITMNTTSTIERTSTVLAKRCEETEKNMNRLLKEAGCPDCERIETTIPLTPGCKDDVVFIGLNGVSFYFMKGRTIQMPKPLLEILTSCKED